MEAVKFRYIYSKNVLIFIICILTSYSLFATHQRAGEITYKHLNGLTYEVTITTYTFAPSQADRCELTLNWGDGQNSIITRSNGPEGTTPANIYCKHVGEMVGKDIRKNIYIGTHTYPSASTYRIWVEDPNRNMGIQNIPNSVDVPLYIETLLVINPFLGYNDSPELLLPPIDNGCVGITFVHNPGAYDPNGDSLSYRLVTPRGAGGLSILGYELPNQVDDSNPGEFSINPLTGDIIWNSPTIQGEYNIALIIEEWRSGVRIGYVTRDMQVNIIACNNDPPQISTVLDTCVIAGTNINLLVSATDTDNNEITLTASGGPLLLSVSPATFNLTTEAPGFIAGELSWSTSCVNVRNQPYQVFFRAEDNDSPVSLVDLKTLNIKVIAPPIGETAAEPLGNQIILSWSKAPCLEAKGYRIYRRAGSSGFIPGECVTGVPPQTGYNLIAVVDGLNSTSFIDDNNDLGLVRGITYCYIITSWFEDGAESIASEEFCVSLKKDLPVITNVSVDSTSGTNGQIYIAWSKPTELDSVQTPGPFIYELYRSQGTALTSEILVNRFFDLNDTIFTDHGMDTQNEQWTYRIRLINNTPGNVFPIGYSVPASSVFLRIQPTDNQLTLSFNENVPWANETYTIYRRTAGAATFDSLATTPITQYQDTGLVNGVQYCYYILTRGTYGTPGYINPIINYSQIACGVPVDNIPPCQPFLTADVKCDELTILFFWENIQSTCAPDLASYMLYQTGSPPTLLATINARDTSYVYNMTDQSITGCYFVVGVDTNNNVDTTNVLTYCIGIDDCPRYRLPNVFTPNNDLINDLFVPFPGYTSVERVEMQIFNRWGVVVFETLEPEIRWDGKDKNTNKLCPEGVYFYKCVVYEVVGSPESAEITNLQKRTLQNSIHLLY